MTSPSARPNDRRAGGRPAPRWLLPLLVVAFVTVPIVEVWLLVAVGQRIGALPTIGILILEAILGGWLMRREGSKAWRALNAAFASGRLPAGELADAALVLVGGVLLMLPGFVTDLIGLVFLLPLTRPLARKLIGFVIARQATKAGIDVQGLKNRAQRDQVIEGEVVADAPTDPTVIRGEITD